MLAALNKAADEITKLISASPNDADQADIERMVQEIKQKIDEINAAIPPSSGPATPHTPAVPSIPAPPHIDPTIEVVVDRSGKNYNLNLLANALHQKSLEKGAHPKFAKALTIIQANPNDAGAIQGAFKSITVTNGPNNGLMVRGGKTRKMRKTKKSRTTKKLRKQKGGYTYKDNKAGYVVLDKTRKNRRKSSGKTATTTGRSSRNTY